MRDGNLLPKGMSKQHVEDPLSNSNLEGVYFLPLSAHTHSLVTNQKMLCASNSHKRKTKKLSSSISYNSGIYGLIGVIRYLQNQGEFLMCPPPF